MDSAKAILQHWLAVLKLAYQVEAVILLLFTVTLGVFFVARIMLRIMKPQIVLDSITVTESVAATGYTGTVIAEKLVDAARTLGLENDRLARKLSVGHTQKDKPQLPVTDAYSPDIDVPGTHLSMRSIVRYIRQEFGWATYLRGEVVSTKDGFILTLRNITNANMAAFSSPPRKYIETLIAEYGAEALLRLTEPQVMVNAYNLKGIELYYLGRYEEAVRQYFKAIELAPENAIAYYNCGLAFYKLEEYEESAGKYRKAISLKPDYAIAYYNYGLLLYQQKQYEAAAEQCQKAIDLDPRYADAYYNCGLALYGLGRYDEAVAKYEKAIALKPEKANFHAALALALYCLRRFSESIGKYRKALALNADYKSIHYNFALALMAVENYQEAADQFEQAVKIEPDNAKAHRLWADALEKTGRPEEAKALRDKAASLEASGA